MDYQRIHFPHPQGSRCLSPNKLRSMLFCREQQQKQPTEDEEAEQQQEVEDDVQSLTEECRDVNMVVTQLPSSSSSNCCFEFQQHPTDQLPQNHRLSTMVPVSFSSKPAPSKWDDAQKWIACPNLQRQGSNKQGKRSSLPPMPPPQATKVVREAVDHAKRLQSTTTVIDNVIAAESCNRGESCANIAEKSVSGSVVVSFSRHDGGAASNQSATAYVAPPPTVRSISMRDMGTEMTPIASQEPSRTGTPTRSTSPLRSPTSSPPRRISASAQCSTNCQGDILKKRELTEEEMKLQTRREIMALGTQLGKMNIAAWASREEEQLASSVSLKNVPLVDQQAKAAIEVRAAAWEEAEKAKYLARFKQEEVKIQAWENHQKAKTEAEMKKIEAEVERIRARAQDKLMQKLAAASHRAEEKRAAAEAKRNQQAARTAQQADYIRRTGRVPSSCCCSSWCS